MACDALDYDYADSTIDAHWRRAVPAHDRHIKAWTLSLLLHGGLLGGLIYLATHWTTPPTFGLVSGRMSLAARGSASAAPRRVATQEINVVFTEPAFTPPPEPAPAQPSEQPVVRLTAPPPVETTPREVSEPTIADAPDAIVVRRPSSATPPAPKIEAGQATSIARTKATPSAAAAAPPAEKVADVVVPARAASAGSNGANVDQSARQVTTNPLPAYPADALMAGIEGEVVLFVRIAADGSVASARVEHSSGTASLDESARSTVERRWRFVPAHRGGVAVEFDATLPIRFSIRSR